MSATNKPIELVRPLVFLDTETTGLHAGRRAWEIGMIKTYPGAGRRDQTYRAFVEVYDLDLANAEPMGLRIGGFYDRHPYYGGVSSAGWVRSERLIMDEVESMTRGATIVGAVPSFDMELLGNAFRRHGLAPSWHHRLVDVETMAAVCLGEMPGLRSLGDYCRALDITVENEGRHTALGDAKLCRKLYGHVMAWRADIDRMGYGTDTEATS